MKNEELTSGRSEKRVLNGEEISAKLQQVTKLGTFEPQKEGRLAGQNKCKGTFREKDRRLEI